MNAHSSSVDGNSADELSRELVAYENSGYSPGRGLITRTAWYYVSLLVFESGWLPLNGFKCSLLRMFGASIGLGVVIHPNVRIKYPWRLSVGDNCWIGRAVWIDNLSQVTLESNVCISQGAYLCTGSHDHKSATFGLRTGPIVIHHGAWICCRSVVLADAIVPRMFVVTANSVYSDRNRKPT